MNVVARWWLDDALLEEVGPEDRKLSEIMDVDQIVVVLWIEPEVRLPDFVRPHVPDEIVVDASAAIFEA